MDVQKAANLRLCITVIFVYVSLLLAGTSVAQTPEADRLLHQKFLQRLAHVLRTDDHDPQTLAEWQEVRRKLQENLRSAMGEFPDQKVPLNAQVLGQLKFDGYRLERVVFQTMPEVLMTASAYIPDSFDGTSRLPAVLCVHGHWPGAKQDPVVQSRCIGLARLGFFVLAVDAFGAGERAIGEKLGEYHGEMTGAMLLPVGRPLSGIQVYENMRAVDYLQSRPEVDPDRIGITGASGGGNQTMYAGALDERFRCVVPTCSVGTYQAYLSAACCMCEMVPGGLTFTEEGDLLGMSVNRGLMVTSATKDAFQFSVDEAKKSVARANAIGSLLNGSSVRHTIIESPHHYNQPMREAMYGWMTLQLKGEGSGEPIAEPAISPADPESIRCFPGETRPDDFMTIPRFAAQEARRRLQERKMADERYVKAVTESAGSEQLSEVRKAAVKNLSDLLGGAVEPCEPNLTIEAAENGASELRKFNTEESLRILAYCDKKSATVKSGLSEPVSEKLLILADADAGAELTYRSPLADQLRAAGYRVVVPELRGTGRFSNPGDRIGNAPDHNSAEWSLWVGRPLCGQWALDISRTIDVMLSGSDSAAVADITVVGVGASGPIVLTASALDERITAVATVNSLASFVSTVPYRGQRLGTMVPGILNAVGDIQHLAALSAPRRVIMAGGVNGGGENVASHDLAKEFSYAAEVFRVMGQPKQLILATPAELIGELGRP